MQISTSLLGKLLVLFTWLRTMLALINLYELDKIQISLIYSCIEECKGNIYLGWASVADRGCGSALTQKKKGCGSES